MELYPELALERVMKVQDVILRAISGKILWMQAAEILGVSARTIRRVRWRYETYGYDGLVDHRRKRPSPKRVDLKTAEEVLRLYRDRYAGFNVRHFVEKLHEEHGIGLSYTWVKKALQGAGMVPRGRRRGAHRKRRERRPLPGMLLHVDGSRHAWLGKEHEQMDLVTLLDDANSELYYAQLVPEEGTLSVMAGFHEVISTRGWFCALYSDRGSHFVFTPKADGPPDRSKKTQIERALYQLGIELIAAHSPQARGRCERLYGTLQGRLPQELRLRRIETVEEANRFLREIFIADFNRRFMVSAAQKGTAFIPYRGRDLHRILSCQVERVVDNDNTVRFDNLRLQLPRQAFRFSLARCRVVVCSHLDQTLSVYYGAHCLGRYASDGTLQPSLTAARRSAA
jgi:transposase